MARKKFVTVSSFSSLLGNNSQLPFNDPATTSKKPSPVSSRMAAKTPSNIKQAEYEINLLARENYTYENSTRRKRLQNVEDLGKLAAATPQNGTVVSTGNCPPVPYDVNLPWHRFSSRFPSLASQLRDEFPLWEPEFADFIEIYKQVNAFSLLHPIHISEFAYHTWYNAELKRILSHEERNWKGDLEQDILKLVAKSERS